MNEAELAKAFESLSSPVRLKILLLIVNARKLDKILTSMEIANILNVSQTNASYHLRNLASSNVTVKHESGTWVYYDICASTVDYMKEFLKLTPQQPVLDEKKEC